MIIIVSQLIYFVLFWPLKKRQKDKWLVGTREAASTNWAATMERGQMWNDEWRVNIPINLASSYFSSSRSDCFPTSHCLPLAAGTQTHHYNQENAQNNSLVFVAYKGAKMFLDNLCICDVLCCTKNQSRVLGAVFFFFLVQSPTFCHMHCCNTCRVQEHENLLPLFSLINNNQQQNVFVCLWCRQTFRKRTKQFFGKMLNDNNRDWVKGFQKRLSHSRIRTSPLPASVSTDQRCLTAAAAVDELEH